VNIPTSEDEESLGEDSPEDLLARYSDESWRPVRDVRDPDGPFQGVPPRRDRFDRQLPWGPVLAAAAAGFLIAIALGPCRSTDPLQQGELANLQSELQTARDRAGQLESELAARESVGKTDAPDERRASEREQHAAPAPSEREQQAAPTPSEDKQPTAPAPKREGRSELTPEEVLRLEKRNANPEAAKEAEPSEAAAPAPTPVSDPSPEPSRAEPDQVAFAESQGSVSVYEAPDPAAPIVRSTSRSELQALAPERAGWTTEAKPTLYWHASHAMQSAGEFTLIREGEDEPLLRARLTAPDGAGIQRIELAQSDVSLEEGTSYRWTVSFADAHSGADRDVATGGIRRVAPPETLRATTGAAPLTERLDALERAGLWYDALDLVLRSIEDNSGAKNLVARRNAMLARVGIQLPSS
jgi:Domain of Unknown Function (DUF928)